jgi:large subunit ribosomal protein L18
VPGAWGLWEKEKNKLNSNTMALTKAERRQRIRYRIRKRLSGSPERPRMSVYRSNKQIYVQLVDDVNGQTLASASSKEKEIASQKVNKTDQAKLVGKLIAQKAKEKGINTVVFDRNGYLYHGRVKNLADAARESGLKI